jgi:uncharacterized membrane protein
MRSPATYLAPVVLLAMAGAGLSGFLLANHYRALDAEFCSINPDFDCNGVNQSEYAEILGVPVAAIGLAGFVALAVMVLDIRLRESPWFRARHVFLVSLGGLGFGTYLTWIEVAVIHKLCLLCLASFALGIAIALLAGLAFLGELRGATAPASPVPSED